MCFGDSDQHKFRDVVGAVLNTLGQYHAPVDIGRSFRRDGGFARISAVEHVGNRARCVKGR
jgi:hypothetical protein